MKTPEQEEGRPRGAVYGPYLTLGLQLALTVVVFFFLGRWLDRKFGTDPWLMLTGLALGVAGGLTSFLRKAVQFGNEEDRESKEEKRSGRESAK